MKKGLFIIIIFTFFSNRLICQSLYDLENCTSYTCLDNWLIKWEKSASDELKKASKLLNTENRQNNCVSILERYAGNTIHYYKQSPRRGPVRTHLRVILTSLDAKESYVDDYILKYDNAYERIRVLYQEALNGRIGTNQNKTTLNSTKPSNLSNSINNPPKNNTPEIDFSKLSIEQKVKLSGIYVSKEKIDYVKKLFTKEQFKKLQICLGIPKKFQTGEYNAVTKYAVEELGIDLSNGWTENVVEKIQSSCVETKD